MSLAAIQEVAIKLNCGNITRRRRKQFVVVLVGFLGVVSSAIPAAGQATRETLPPALTQGKPNYAAAAQDVTNYIQKTFYIPAAGLYEHSDHAKGTEFMWGNGVMFSALVAAARHDPARYQPIMNRFFQELDHYWDARAPIPGYEPSQTSGNGNDKYYDDNAWMVLTFAEAYEQTHERRYLDRARKCLTFVLSGWDEQAGGGIWWHVAHKGDAKNTCVNAPAAVGCLRLADLLPDKEAAASVAMAEKIVDWTTKTFEADDGLFFDSIKVGTGKINRGKLTYNTALMIRAFLGLYRHTGNEKYLEQARRSATAGDWFLSDQTHAYRDSFKWSHLMVEADLEMFRATHDEHLLRRAMDNADYEYANWEQKPPADLIDNASVARTLWLMADMQSPAAREFWQRVDRNRS